MGGKTAILAFSAFLSSELSQSDEVEGHEKKRDGPPRSSELRGPYKWPKILYYGQLRS